MFAADDDSKVPYIVNASGRFIMDQIEATLAHDDVDALQKDGKFVFKFINTIQCKSTTVKPTYQGHI